MDVSAINAHTVDAVEQIFTQKFRDRKGTDGLSCVLSNFMHGVHAVARYDYQADKGANTVNIKDTFKTKILYEKGKYF